MPIRILIADDHQLLREGIRNFLSLEPDFEIIGEAANGEEAIARAIELRPDVLLLDINMPGMNGIEVLRQMKEMQATLPIILNSAYQEYKQDFGSWASEAYVVKSANMEELKAAVRKYLE